MDTDILDGVSAAEVKNVVEKIAAGAIATFEVNNEQYVQE